MTLIGEPWQRCPKRKLTPLVRERLAQLERKAKTGRVTLEEFLAALPPRAKIKRKANR